MAMQDSEQFVSFLHSLSDMGAAMRTAITKVLSNAEMYSYFNQGNCVSKSKSKTVPTQHTQLLICAWTVTKMLNFHQI